ncbi:HAD-IIA family hydrolase [Trichlorobacter sp.]|uniref:HAD-IIA family hydrolase n=1 Tax=Trichlorobacter sp. TaxID=2911007 RepID=UPI002A359F86|nr:HAD-IIA family hydrolase [Trichlorobacter sp.]MDD2398964.1 HAD-IIA family hydrolase [Bacilli bacterium]MDD4344486.1 HAD-IIA family hydrolase [Bacilli bacterium]MDD4469280.1 HAD-IIA family hydrolase [Acholeplasmataceae bacterium]MDY0385482.1 HAD-IIA family hydrolase [Trichlorobacter sp.]
MEKTDINGKSLLPLANKKLFLLDQDGTLYEGDHLFPATQRFLSVLKKANISYMFITNNSSRSIKDYVKKMDKLGIESSPEEFYTSVEATLLYIKSHYPHQTVYPVGTASFIQSLVENGIELASIEKADIALLAYDTEITYEKLVALSKMLTLRDVIYLATNPDWVCPTSFGFIPDCGSMAFMIEKATGKKPLFIGKPSPLMINTILNNRHLNKEDVVVIGDRLYTDIASAQNAGVDSIAVLSGEVTLDEIKKYSPPPTYVINDVGDLINLFK